MALPKQYLTAKHNSLEDYFTTVFSGQAPEKFTIRFLTDLEFKSTNDRLFIGVLKSLGFLDESGIPTQRYFEALDQTNTKKLVAEGIREAYADLFQLDRNAQNLELEKIKGRFTTLTEGKPAPATINHMAKTFRGLCDYADWAEPKKPSSTKPKDKIIPDNGTKPDKVEEPTENYLPPESSGLNLKYDIHIHLPPSTNPAVYDALFTSLKKHLID